MEQKNVGLLLSEDGLLHSHCGTEQQADHSSLGHRRTRLSYRNDNVAKRDGAWGHPVDSWSARGKPLTTKGAGTAKLGRRRQATLLLVKNFTTATSLHPIGSYVSAISASSSKATSWRADPSNNTLASHIGLPAKDPPSVGRPRHRFRFFKNHPAGPQSIESEKASEETNWAVRLTSARRVHKQYWHARPARDRPAQFDRGPYSRKVRNATRNASRSGVRVFCSPI